MTTITIDPLSCNSLYLTCIYQGTQLGTATGYIIYAKGKNYLITNWHVLSGRNPQNNQPLAGLYELAKQTACNILCNKT